MTTLWIVLGIVLAIVIFAWSLYNGLVKLGIRVDEAWSDITVQLKLRADTIPGLVESVKAYAAHEKGVFENVSAARAGLMNAKGVKETAAADGQFEAALKSLFAVAEAYPQLRANENFLQLQTEFSDLNNKIQAARRFYNGGVRDLNTRIKLFPNNLIAGMLGYKEREFFELSEEDQKAAENVTIKF